MKKMISLNDIEKSVLNSVKDLNFNLNLEQFAKLGIQFSNFNSNLKNLEKLFAPFAPVLKLQRLGKENAALMAEISNLRSEQEINQKLRGKKQHLPL